MCHHLQLSVIKSVPIYFFCLWVFPDVASVYESSQMYPLLMIAPKLILWCENFQMYSLLLPWLSRCSDSCQTCSLTTCSPGKNVFQSQFLFLVDIMLCCRLWPQHIEILFREVILFWSSISARQSFLYKICADLNFQDSCHYPDEWFTFYLIKF